MKRLGMICLASVAALVGPFSGPLHAGAASSPCTVWTDPANDEHSTIPGEAGPQNDLIRATMSTTGDTLVARIHVQNMSLAMPPGMTSMTWTLNWGGHELDAWVQSSGTDTYITYYDIDYIHHSGGGDSGTVVAGPGGYVEIDVPFSHLGIKDGDTLAGISGTAAIQTAFILTEIADTAGGSGQYRVGSSC